MNKQKHKYKATKKQRRDTETIKNKMETPRYKKSTTNNEIMETKVRGKTDRKQKYAQINI